MGSIKIIIPDESSFVPKKALEQYADDVYIIRYGLSKENNTPFHLINIPYEACILGQSSVTLGDERYANLMKYSDNILKELGEECNSILVIADMFPESLLVAKMLQKKWNDTWNIHLWCFLPFSFVPSKQEEDYFSLIVELTEIKSLLVFDLDDVLQQQSEKMQLSEFVDYVRDMCEDMFETIYTQISNVKNYGVDNKYFFDFREKRYVNTSGLQMINGEYITKLMGICGERIIDGPEDEYTVSVISRPRVRIDGHAVCGELRRLRKAFAHANKLNYKFRVCTYTGPCAGTCDYCEQEARELYALALKKKGKRENIEFPQKYLMHFFLDGVSISDDSQTMVMGDIGDDRYLYKNIEIEKREWDY